VCFLAELLPSAGEDLCDQHVAVMLPKLKDCLKVIQKEESETKKSNVEKKPKKMTPFLQFKAKI
jgi:hypothetical protein